MIKRGGDVWRAKLRQSLHRWLRDNPGYHRALRKFRCFSSTPKEVSRGVAIGLFFGLTPTASFQTPMVLPCCIFFRGNFPMAFISTWVTNPLTIPPAYFAFNQIGGWLYSGPLISVSTAEKHPWSDLVTSETFQLFAGSIVIAVPVAILGYFIAYWSATRINRIQKMGR